MTPINKLPNYYAGKIYSHWDSIKELREQSGLLATKLKKGKHVQLLITKNGNKRELLFNDGKIMDTVDIKGVKRTYTYRKDQTNAVKGQMIIAQTEDKKNPLVIAAKWISRSCMPERLFLKLNPKHSGAEIFVPAKHLPENTKLDFLGLGKTIKVQEILAKDFENVYNPIPKTIILKTTRGETQAILADTAEENMPLIKQLGIESDILGWKLRTMV